jgi:hypothetical protein
MQAGRNEHRRWVHGQQLRGQLRLWRELRRLLPLAHHDLQP